MRKAHALVLLVLMAAGCASVREQKVALVPGENSCTVREVRTSLLASTAFAICWDAEGRPIGMIAGNAIPEVSIPESLLNTAAIATAGALIGHGLSSVGTPQVNIPSTITTAFPAGAH